MTRLRTILVVLSCAATAWAASKLSTPKDRAYDVAVIPPARLLSVASLGHPTLAADLYWLRTVQYIGDSHSSDRGWNHLFPLVDLVTCLDPDHGYAYQVGGVILGSVGLVAESNSILEKGIRALPSRYTLALLRGANAMLYEGDYVTAGRYMEVAARAPGAPAHLSENVLAMFVKGRQADAAVAFLESMLAEVHDPDTRTALERQLRQARLEQIAQPLDAAARAYAAQFGFLPATVEQLVAAGLVQHVPPDPFGGSLVILQDGRIHSSVNDFRFKPARVPSPSAEPGVNPARDYRNVR